MRFIFSDECFVPKHGTPMFERQRRGAALPNGAAEVSKALRITVRNL
jgi:hypothetical protein